MADTGIKWAFSQTIGRLLGLQTEVSDNRTGPQQPSLG